MAGRGNDNGFMASVTVPAYCVACYFEEGIACILNLDFKQEVEVIVIADCSTEDSLKKCWRYATNYPNTRLLTNLS